MAPEYTLGQPVTFTRTLTRRARWDDQERVMVKRWDPEEYPGQPIPAKRPGIIVGARTLSNGHVRWNGGDAPSVYVHGHQFTAYLVAYDLRRKPVLVLPAHLRADAS